MNGIGLSFGSRVSSDQKGSGILEPQDPEALQVEMMARENLRM